MTEHQTSPAFSENPSHEHHGFGKPTKLTYPVAVALVFILVLYGILLSQGIPQKWTEESNASYRKIEQKANDGAVSAPDAKKNDEKRRPPSYMLIPFAVLLLAIAFFPLVPAITHWWENNANKFWVGSSLGLLALLYYYFVCDFPINQYWPGKSVVDPAVDGSFAVTKAVFVNAIIYEFFPFIVLLFALFTITGGIRICSSLKATPFINTVILTIGTLLASFIGTTGAAMLLIRPLLEMNRGRKHKVHTIVFFIFCVCNCGGCLTPLGDPPLFLGYLRGVAFEWPFFALWPMWAIVNLFLLTVYLLWDSLWFYPRELKESVESKNDPSQKLFTISGWKLNAPLLLGVIAAIAFLDPGRPVPGTDWHPWFYMREAAQLGLAAISLFFSSLSLRKENVFNFFAIGEVAALFFGIFLCMQAPLQILSVEGKNIVAHAGGATGLNKEKLFFWTTGLLGSALDNAPTYVVFFEAARAVSPETEAEHKKWREETGREFEPVPVRGGTIDHKLLIAVSLGTVFMGAMTYIANAPNFLVKAIAEQDKVAMPSFFGFMGYSCLIVLPVLTVMAFVFLYDPPATEIFEPCPYCDGTGHIVSQQHLSDFQRP